MTPEGEQCRQMICTALADYHLPDSESAIRLLCMIAAHESGGFRFTKQIRGPAVSLFQIEPASFRDVCNYAKRKGIDIPNAPPERLIFDEGFAAAIGRLFFMRFRESLPQEDDLEGLASYAKRYWNTEKGKATVADYHDAYEEHFV